MQFRSRILAMLILSCALAMPVMAAQIDTSGLTEAQVAEIQARAANIKSENLKKPAEDKQPTINTISQYAQLGKDLGVGLASTARELGVATNEFAQTPVGHIAMALIIYKVIGNSVIHLVCGFLWLTSATILFIYFFRRLYMYESIVTNYDPTTGKRISIIRKPMNPKDSAVMGGRIILGVAMGVASAVGLFITFTG